MSEELMSRYYATYNSESAEALADFYHPDVELHSAEGVMRGRDEVLATYRYLVSIFEDRMEPDRIAIEAGTAKVWITDRLKARKAIDDFMGVSLAEGETLTLELMGTYRIEKGQFVYIVIAAQD